MVTAPLFVSQADSTNSWCRRKLEQLPDGFAVYTTCQTARTWPLRPGLGQCAGPGAVLYGGVQTTDGRPGRRFRLQPVWLQ